MCGIAGFTTFRAQPRGPEQVLRSMTAPLRPRGPDGEGYYEDGWIRLGHRRLSIIDIEGGAQPMSTGSGRFHISYNGEVYNYIELRQHLQSRGLSFATASDTEVVLQQLGHYGVPGLDELNGMFAFAFWDAQRGALLLARDRMGIKPLYYYIHNGDVVFASELKSLIRHPAVPRQLDLLSVSKYFTFGYIPAPHTIYKDVYKLEPGTYLAVSDKDIRKSGYWDIPIEEHAVFGQNLDQCAEELMALLEDAVRKRLRSDVPVGVFLSGGIDSSAVTALAAQAVSGKLHTFSVGFEESSYDESPYALEVARLYGTEHHHEVLSMKRALELLPDVMRILDEPFGDPSILPTYLLSQFTARHVKVVLGGDGGDELYAGYPAFQAHKLTEKLSFLPVTWRDRLTRLARHLPVSHRYASVDFLLQQFFKGQGISPEIRFFLWLGCFGNEQKKELLSADVQRALLTENPYEDIINYVRQSRLVSDFERILYLCAKLYLQDDILAKVDRASMANSLEVRVPLLDHHHVEYAARIHPAYKLKGFTTKYVLKRAVRDLLPKRIVERRKAGFMIPVATWIERDLREMVEELCAPRALEEVGLFNPGYVRRLLDEHFTHTRDHRKLIWPLLCFMIWRRHYGSS